MHKLRLRRICKMRKRNLANSKTRSASWGKVEQILICPILSQTIKEQRAFGKDSNTAPISKLHMEAISIPLQQIWVFQLVTSSTTIAPLELAEVTRWDGDKMYSILPSAAKGFH